MMKLEHSGKEQLQHIPRLLPLSSAAFLGFLKNSIADTLDSLQDAFINKILLYRFASSFSPMQYDRNRIRKLAKKLFLKKAVTR